MLLLLKKSMDKGDSVQSMAWHPNFTDASRLPDVKVVRTTFFVNIASIVLLGVVLYFVGSREYTVYQHNLDIESLDTEISALKPDSNRAVATFNKFKVVEKKLGEVMKLSSDSFVFSDYLMHLGNTLPERVTLKNFIYRGPRQPASITMSVEGLDATSGEIASKYIKQIKEDKVTGGFFGEVTLTSPPVRNVVAQNLTLEISMAPKPTQK